MRGQVHIAVYASSEFYAFLVDFSLYGSDVTPENYSPPSPPDHAYTPTAEGNYDPVNYDYDEYEYEDRRYDSYSRSYQGRYAEDVSPYKNFGTKQEEEEVLPYDEEFAAKRMKDSGYQTYDKKKAEPHAVRAPPLSRDIHSVDESFDQQPATYNGDSAYDHQGAYDDDRYYRPQKQNSYEHYNYDSYDRSYDRSYDESYQEDSFDYEPVAPTCNEDFARTDDDVYEKRRSSLQERHPLKDEEGRRSSHEHPAELAAHRQTSFHERSASLTEQPPLPPIPSLPSPPATPDPEVVPMRKTSDKAYSLHASYEKTQTVATPVDPPYFAPYVATTSFPPEVHPAPFQKRIIEEDEDELLDEDAHPYEVHQGLYDYDYDREDSLSLEQAYQSRYEVNAAAAAAAAAKTVEFKEVTPKAVSPPLYPAPVEHLSEEDESLYSSVEDTRLVRGGGTSGDGIPMPVGG
ncbi:hypothetical protein CAPTEDRAFT_203060 [Capitella teleta]|uniref:Uncharacterized protein n=1 Tax=Capitella teleta TaxID=283909 RepID=R7TS46_CAPTE|nr:hypothetical protein CAPTEDRAFT_203060 [Capitella teleta]|eukprot:ELT96422.1 hypothetical protein CAPTEDRAFT_203060 [Capitella teleta]